MHSKLIPLPLAATRLRMTWGQAYNATLSGKLEGERRGSRWFVTTASVHRLARERGLKETVSSGHKHDGGETLTVRSDNGDES